MFNGILKKVMFEEGIEVGFKRGTFKNAMGKEDIDIDKGIDREFDMSIESGGSMEGDEEGTMVGVGGCASSVEPDVVVEVWISLEVASEVADWMTLVVREADKDGGNDADVGIKGPVFDPGAVRDGGVCASAGPFNGAWAATPSFFIVLVIILEEDEGDGSLERPLEGTATCSAVESFFADDFIDLDCDFETGNLEAEDLVYLNGRNWSALFS